MPDSESPVADRVTPAACECRAWACSDHPAASYYLVTHDGDVLTHHPACRHAVTEALSDDDFEVLAEIELAADAHSDMLARELERARAWASRWKALAKALHTELMASRAETTDTEFVELTTPSSIHKVGRSSGLRLRSLLSDGNDPLEALAAGAEQKR